jgi:hypothetical protein
VARGEITCIGLLSSSMSSRASTWLKPVPVRFLLPNMLTMRFRTPGRGELFRLGEEVFFVVGFDSLAPSSWSILMVNTVCLVLVLSTVKLRVGSGVGSE